MKKIFWSLVEIVQTITIAVVIVFLVRTFVAQPFLVSGASMEPNFYNGNYLLVDELAYRFREPERGEVIVFRYPGDHRSFYIKRIIGLPGERVTIDEGGVTIYAGGEELTLDEPYVQQSKHTGHIEVVLDEHQYFVMGDNRNFSFDSRSWGPLERQDIIGIVRFRLWPVSEVKVFSAPAY